jgi:serine/threonine protein kinase
MSQENIISIQNEINLLTKLNHPNIVKYIDFIRTNQNFNVILEYVEGGSLNNIVRQNGIPECLVCIFAKQILEGLDYLHSQGIIHRDIKGGNLLITKNGIVKLADFGYSVNLTDRDRSNSMVGTCFWMAPEVLEQKGNVSYACDIWSLGCTIIQLITSKPPYSEFDIYGALYRIIQDEHPPLPEGISDYLVDFLKLCFIKDPKNRPEAKELLNHLWITNPNKKMVKRILNEKDSNINHVIPSSIFNEWKIQYRDNPSITSSHNDKINRSVSNDIIKS